MNLPPTVTQAPRRPVRGLAATLALLLCSVALATTYRWVDSDGVVHYSDQPQPGAQKVDLPKAQTYVGPAPIAAPKAVPAVPAVPAAAPAPPLGPRDCAITAPTSEQAFSNAPSVVVTARGPVGSRAKLMFDGGQLQKSLTGEFRIQPIYRGTHTVIVVFTTAGGGELCRTAPVTFFVRQQSILNRAQKH